MTEMTTINELPPEHWGEFLAYLSMDLTEPFWAWFGFAPTRGINEIRSDLRGMIAELRERAHDAGPEGPMPDIRALVFRENQMQWSEDELNDLARLGQDFHSTHSDNPHLSAWQIALIYFPDSFPKTVELVSEPETIAELVLRRDQSPDSIDIPTPLSGWDAQLCARHGWNPLSEAGFPPVDVPTIALSIANAQAVLNLASAKLSPAARRILHLEADALVESMGVWMPEPLKPLALEVEDAAH